MAPKSAIVVDAGSFEVKAGAAGDQKPRCVFPSLVGVPRPPAPSDAAAVVGAEARSSSSLNVSSPVKRGRVEDWKGMESIWRHALQNSVPAVDGAGDRPVLLAQCPAAYSLKTRAKVAELFFESLSCPALSIRHPAVLALYAAGSTTGVVLECGDGVTQAVPVYEGFVLPDAVQRSTVAGCDVTDYIGLLLRRGGQELYGKNVPHTLREIKERMCYVPFDSDRMAADKDWLRSLEKSEAKKTYTYDLPDGTVLQLGSERFRAPDVLFRPSALGSESSGVGDLIAGAIARCEVQLRKSLYSNIVLTGGSTMFKGFGDRTKQELRNISKEANIRICAPPDRAVSTWVGGSIVASLASFSSMCVTKAQYNEHGNTMLYGDALF